MHRVIESHNRITDYFTRYAQLAEPNEISRGKRRYHFSSNGTRRVFSFLRVIFY